MVSKKREDFETSVISFLESELKLRHFTWEIGHETYQWDRDVCIYFFRGEIFLRNDRWVNGWTQVKGLFESDFEMQEAYIYLQGSRYKYENGEWSRA